MNPKYAYPPPKKASGIALRPELWERISRYAQAQGKSKNEVMEDVLELYVPALTGFGIREALSSYPENSAPNNNIPFQDIDDDEE